MIASLRSKDRVDQNSTWGIYYKLSVRGLSKVFILCKILFHLCIQLSTTLHYFCDLPSTCIMCVVLINGSGVTLGYW